jgi:hypothetical protein
MSIFLVRKYAIYKIPVRPELSEGSGDLRFSKNIFVEKVFKIFLKAKIIF